MALLLRSNATLIEWLTSPIRYRDWDAADALLDLARSAASPEALSHHYAHQARHGYDVIREGAIPVHLKTYCYALRSALALEWIRRREQAPPMDVGALMAGLVLPGSLPRAIRDLIAAKSDATEAAVMPRLAVFDDFIVAALTVPVARRNAVPRAAMTARADTFSPRPAQPQQHGGQVINN